MKKIICGAASLLLLSVNALAQAPGGVSNGLKLWLKADAGITTATGVSEWKDFSGNNNDFTQQIPAKQPAYIVAGHNYNPTLNFSNTVNQYLDRTTGILGMAGYNAAAVFAVSDHNSSETFPRPVFYEGTDPLATRHFLLAAGPAGAYWRGDNNTSLSTISTFNPIADELFLWSGINRSNTQSIRRNGLQMSASNLATSYTGSGTIAYIGNYPLPTVPSSQSFRGYVDEVIVYTSALTELEVQKIQTYNAIKWGITLNQTNPYDYVATDGSVVWNATANSSYKTAIAGIACDSAEALAQKQSLSYPVTIGLGSIANSNLGNTTHFTNDKSYLCWGNNGVPDGTQTTDLPAAFSNGQRLSLEWKVQTTNFNNATNPLSFSFNLGSTAHSGLSLSDFRLLIDTDGDGDFTTGSIVDIPATSWANNILGFQGVTQLTNGAVFTVVTKTSFLAPGGVTTGLRLWLRADMNVSTTTGVNKWFDQTINAIHYTQTTANNQPVYNSASDLLNYNPTLTFSGNKSLATDGRVFPIVPVNTPYTGVSLFAISQSAAPTSGAVFYQQLSIFGPKIQLQTDSTGDIVWEGGAPAIRTLATSWGSLMRNKPTLLSCVNNPGNQVIYCNGTAAATTNIAGTFPSTNSTNNNGIGVNGFNGRLSEIIVYANGLTPVDVQKIQSYNALKYGITLDQATAYNYLATDGTVIWNGATNSAYKVNIGGIGRDDIEGLRQKQSRSVHTNSIVAIGRNTVEATNAANTGTFTNDKSYLCWGSNNNLSTSISTDLPGVTYAARLAQEWKVQTTNFDNTTQPVELKFDLTGVTGMDGIAASNYKLLIDSDGDGDFTTGTVMAIPATGYSTNLLTINNVTQLTNGAVFTLASVAIPLAPGGVTHGLKLWLRADTGVAVGTGASQWLDMSGNGNNFQQTTGSAQPQYNTTTALSNFNPTLRFESGKSIARTAGILNSGTYNVASLFSVSAPDALSDAPIFSEETSTPSGYLSLKAPGNGSILWNGPQSVSLSAAWGGTSGNTYLWSGINGNNTQSFRRNGLQIASGTAISASFSGNNNPSYIGSVSPSDYYNGSINEIIIYTDVLSASDVQKIQTYNAIKYGITLDQTTPYNYVNTEGNVVWNATVNSAYNNNIAGIASDNLEALLQKQSRSANTAAIVTFGLGTIANSNATNTNAFASDRSYLCWGSNSNALTTQTTDLPAMFATGQRLTQEWKIQAANFSNAVLPLSLQFDLSGIPGVAGGAVSDFSILIDTDGDGNFGTGAITTLPATGFNANIVTVSGVTQLSNGVVFTLLTKSATYAPGGVTAGLKLWLKADMGAVTATGISRWADQTLNGNHFVQNMAGNQPVFNSGTSLQNFNPTVGFNAALNQALSKPAGILGSSSYNAASVFAVSQNTTLNNGPVLFEPTGPGTSGTFALSPAHIDGNAYWDGDQSVQVSAPWGGTSGMPYLWSGLNGATTQSLRRNGLQIASGNNTTSFIGNNNIASIGYNAASADYFNGNVNEIIVYNTALSSTDVQKIHTYNAIKWGLTLDQTTPTDYIATDGSVVWNATINNSYKINIAGIARDSVEALVQKQSGSINSGSIVSIGLGTIAATNSANSNNFATDKSYLTWASNSASTTVQITELPIAICDIAQRLTQEWKVQTTNFTNTAAPLQLKFDLGSVTGASGTGVQHFSLLIDKDGDGDFGTGPVVDIPATSLASNVVTFNNITQLKNGAVFTLATMRNINADPAVYLPADGTNMTSNVQCYKSGWLYFKQPADPGTYIAAIYDPNFLIDPTKISVTVNTSSAYNDIGKGNNSRATRLMRRMLEVNCNNCFDTVANPTPNFTVRFRFADAEKTAARNTETNNLATIKAANGLLAYDSFYWFKINGTVASMLPSLSPAGFPSNISSVWTQYAFTNSPGSVDITNVNRFSVFGGMWSTIPNVPLAIMLKKFEGRPGEECVTQLNWELSPESTCKTIEVQYSNDGHSFSIVGQVTASETTSFNYKQPDQAGYYRLLLLDIDGRSEYSKTININNNCNTDGFRAILYPNPAKEKVTLNLSSKEDRNISVRVYNASGQLVMPATNYTVNKNKDIILNTSRWTPGLYQIVSRDEVTGATRTSTLVKK